MRHRGYSLIELLLSIAILGLLVGLTISAVQKVRTAAARTEFTNQMRQIQVAYSNCMPSGFKAEPTSGHVYHRLRDEKHLDLISVRDEYQVWLDTLVNKADSSYAAYPYLPKQGRYGNSNVALNGYLLAAKIEPSRSPDGASNTILMAERYARCREADIHWGGGWVTCFDQTSGTNVPVPCVNSVIGIRPSSFADPAYLSGLEAVPVPGPTPGTTTGSIPGLTFQDRPRPQDCDVRIPQSVFPGGLLTGFADGSVRPIHPGVAPSVFWAAVTPAGGESAQLE